MSKVQELPKYERPREKAKRFGIESLSNEELLALILATGTKDVPVLDLSHQLLADSHGLVNLFQKDYESLLDVKGIGPSKALLLSACFELSKRYDNSRYTEERTSTSQLYHRYLSRLRSSGKELMVLVITNKKGKIVHEATMYQGSDVKVDFSVKEIIRKVLVHSGKYFYLLHNHPSGNCNPSPVDLSTTLKVIEESKKVNIELIDHIIIGDNGYWSYRDGQIVRINYA